MKKKKVLIPTKLDPGAGRLLEKAGAYEVFQDSETGLSSLAQAHPDAYALIVRSEKVTAEVLDAMPGLKVVIRAGAGYNTIDTKHARKRHIDVMNTPGANANAVAELTLSFMLADARHLIAADSSVRAGKWEKKKFMGTELSQKMIGIVGLGYIGKLVARRLSGFDVRLLGYDPIITEERAREMDVELAGLSDLFAQSDYITLHVPENDETRGMINTALLSRMKPGAALINCARAGIINEDDLRAAVQDRGIHYLNDVYAKDAEGPKSVSDVARIMLPHLGASTVEANRNAAERAARQLIEFDEKGITTYIVNRDIPAGLDEAYADLAYTLTRLCRQVVGKEHKLKLVESSFYGNLQPYADWLIVPIVTALCDDFDRSSDFKAARQYLENRGVDYVCRETDDRKGYENSITIDLTATVDSGHLVMASVRGTVAENTLMVSRINDFEKLYFEPRGHTVFFVYEDRPGVLGQIGVALAEGGVNIDDMRNPHDLKGRQSIAIIKVNQAVPEEIIEKARTKIKASAAFYLEL